MDPRADRVRAELRATRLRVALKVAHLLEHRAPHALPPGPVLLAAALVATVVVACAALQRWADGRRKS